MASACAPSPLWNAYAEDDALWIVGPRDTAAYDLPGIMALEWGRDGVSLYAVADHRQTATLYELRRDDGSVTARLPVGGEGASNIVIDAQARMLYVGIGPDVRAFALAPLTSRYSVTACDAQVTSLVLFEPRTKAFVLCESGIVGEIDTELVELQRSLRLPEACLPTGLTFARNESLLLVPCLGRPWTYRIDRVTLTTFDSIPTSPISGSDHVTQSAWPRNTPLYRFLPWEGTSPPLDPAQP